MLEKFETWISPSNQVCTSVSNLKFSLLAWQEIFSDMCREILSILVNLDSFEINVSIFLFFRGS